MCRSRLVVALFLVCLPGTFGVTDVEDTPLTFGDLAYETTLGASVLNFTFVNITAQGKTISQMGIVGTGPQWRVVNGVGGIWVKPNETQYRVIYQNLLNEQTTLHQHGITPPQNLDGVPFLSQVPIQPGHSHYYSIDLNKPNVGTYFLHSHYSLQHPLGLSAPLIIEGPFPPSFPDAELYDTATDVLMFLQDACFFPAGTTPAPNVCLNPRAAFPVVQAAWNKIAPTWNYSACPVPTKHASSVTHLYNLVNYRTIDDPITVRVQPGQTIRLRVVSSTGMSHYRIDLPFDGTLVAVDGEYTQPLVRRSFWIAVAQRLDIMLTIPKSSAASVLPIFAVHGSPDPNPGQGGMLLLVGGAAAPAPNTYPLTYSGISGIMGEWPHGFEQESVIKAWIPLSQKKPDRVHTIHVTGNMGFNSINGRSFRLYPFAPLPFKPNPHPLMVKYGERVCIDFINHNNNAHPFHLHGHSFQVEQLGNVTLQGGAIRDVILIPAGGCRKTRICFDAVNPGVWPLHCHMSYHLAAGMLTTVEYGHGAAVPPGPYPSAYISDKGVVDDRYPEMKLYVAIAMLVTLLAIASFAVVFLVMRVRTLSRNASLETAGLLSAHGSRSRPASVAGSDTDYNSGSAAAAYGSTTDAE